MQRLLALRNTREDETDSERNQARDEFREESAGCPPEGNPPSGQIRHGDVQNFFPRCALPLRAFEAGVIKPVPDNREQNEYADSNR